MPTEGSTVLPSLPGSSRGSYLAEKGNIPGSNRAERGGMQGTDRAIPQPLAQGGCSPGTGTTSREKCNITSKAPTVSGTESSVAGGTNSRAVVGATGGSSRTGYARPRLLPAYRRTKSHTPVGSISPGTAPGREEESPSSTPPTTPRSSPSTPKSATPPMPIVPDLKNFCEVCAAAKRRGSTSSLGGPGTNSLPRSKRRSYKSYARTQSLPRGLLGPKPPNPRKKAIKDVVYYIFGCGSGRSQKVDGYNQFQLKDEIAEVTSEMENMDISEEKHNPKSKHLSIGRKKFNMDPKKGIEYLIEHELLQNTAEEVAQFLYKGEGLNKTAIGDYLGERNDFNMEVLKAFVNLHEFSDMILVQALRQFLWSFRLPGEAQKIDRMMECFAARYCELNTGVFTSADTCYVLSFAIIMLNTSLHNPSVRDKPSVERFIEMNRGINDGGDLPPELLISLYDSIKKEPFKIPEDDGNDLMHTFFNPDKEGWLWKQGGRYKSWKRRWFILNDNCLYYFEFTTDKEPKGIIPLENIQVREVADRNKPNCFELFSVNNDVIKACKTDADGKVVEGKHSVYRMSAASQEEKEEWITCIRASIADNPFYDMLSARRKKAQHQK